MQLRDKGRGEGLVNVVVVDRLQPLHCVEDVGVVRGVQEVTEGILRFGSFQNLLYFLRDF